MPLGSRHREEGMLLREGAWLILQRDDGGRWRLNGDPGLEKYLGLRVRIEGIRSGFDLIEVVGSARC